mgnify:CR=1 FL=1
MESFDYVVVGGGHNGMAAVATLAYSVTFALTQFLLGVDSPVSGLVVRDIIIGVVINSIIAIPLFGAVRALLRPSLIDSHRPRRRSPAPRRGRRR